MCYCCCCCCRLIGEVLVERDVGETMPAVKRNKENIDKLVETLSAQFEAKKTELGEFAAKYNIRVRGKEEGDDDSAAGTSSGGQGVLVSNT